MINDRKQKQSCKFTMFQEIKSLYPSVIYPNKTLYNTNMSGIRRFTPDGKYLLCIGSRVVSLYKYLGPVPKQGVADDFAKFFTLKYEKALTAGNEIICKDFSLFTQDQKRMVLASAASNESHHTSLDDITFWILDIESGQILGSKTFLNDYIFLNNNSGVHLFKNYLAIASVQKQAIYICHIRVRF
jgi:hypothetical protein